MQLSSQLGNKLSNAELREVMAAIDEDGSGEVDFREFYKWWSSDGKDTVLKPYGQEEHYTIVPL